MQLNLKWVIIGAIFVILVVAMGSNPGEEAQREREEAAKRPDALIRAIEEHNTQSPFSKFTGSQPDGGSGLPVPTVNTGTDHLYPSYLTNDTNPFAKGLDQPPPVERTYQQPGAPASPNSFAPAPQAQPAQNQNDYYPPAPEPPNFKPRSGLEKRLITGQPLEFVGSEVYTLDAKGKRIRMPDGVYKMKDSQLTLVVRDGHKIAIQ